MNERLLIVTADDYGLTDGVCTAILDAHERGVVTSTSALVVAPAFERNAARLAASGAGVGAHLCLVGEDPPLLAAREIPSLVDARGYFAPDWRRFARRAAIGRIDAADVRRELSAQLDALDGAGITPTHVDSHQHLHQLPAVASVVLDLARQRGVRAVRVTRSVGRSASSLAVRALGRRFRHRAAAAGLVTTDGAAGLDTAGHLTVGAILAELARAASVPGLRSFELSSHPGSAVDPDRARYDWGYDWAGELDALCHPSVRKAVVDNGFRLGTFADLVSGSDRASA